MMHHSDFVNQETPSQKDLTFVYANAFPFLFYLTAIQYFLSHKIKFVGTSNISHDFYSDTFKTGFPIKSQPPILICRHQFFRLQTTDLCGI